jgi:hypothetical protein
LAKHYKKQKYLKISLGCICQANLETQKLHFFLTNLCQAKHGLNLLVGSTQTPRTGFFNTSLVQLARRANGPTFLFLLKNKNPIHKQRNKKALHFKDQPNICMQHLCYIISLPNKSNLSYYMQITTCAGSGMHLLQQLQQNKKKDIPHYTGFGRVLRCCCCWSCWRD